MKTKILSIPILLMICAFSQTTFAQQCSGTDVWSCYYYSIGGYFCGCVSSSSTEAQQCSNGQVLACRIDQHCDWVCECVDTNDVADWLSHAHKCNGGGMHGGWHHWHGGYRIGENSNDDKSFSAIYPNPVSSFATISFSLDEKENISVKLLDVTGRVITIIADRVFEEGKNEIVWNASDVNAGIYFLTMEGSDFFKTEKITITK